jgi:hypothetical protein
MEKSDSANLRNSAASPGGHLSGGWKKLLFIAAAIAPLCVWGQANRLRRSGFPTFASFSATGCWGGCSFVAGTGIAFPSPSVIGKRHSDRLSRSNTSSGNNDRLVMRRRSR